MPKHIYDGKDIPTNAANRAPVGLGPFKFVKWEEGRGITFTRNEYYWDQPKPYLNSVVAVFIPNVQQQLNALYRGEIDVLRPALPQIGRTIEQAKAKNAFEVREIKVNAAERLSLDVNTTREIVQQAAGPPGAADGDRSRAHLEGCLPGPGVPGDERDPRAVHHADRSVGRL